MINSMRTETHNKNNYRIFNQHVYMKIKQEQNRYKKPLFIKSTSVWWGCDGSLIFFLQCKVLQNTIMISISGKEWIIKIPSIPSIVILEMLCMFNDSVSFFPTLLQAILLDLKMK